MRVPLKTGRVMAMMLLIAVVVAVAMPIVRVLSV